MNCHFNTCINYVILSAILAIGVYLLIYFILYIYIVNITQRDYSTDLIKWREDALMEVDTRYAKIIKDESDNAL